MTTRRKFATLAMASAAAALFSAAPVSAAETGSEAKVHCFGVNKCKGHNDCKTAKNACKGHASCKGQGFVTMSKHACEEIGGSVNKPKDNS
ncbi:MAG: hypothetical protein PVG75_11950 [Thioalkalispiraceae bacterium]|jgi:uncharacterized membrane protein